MTLINLFFFFNDTATTEIYTLSLHDALPISRRRRRRPPATNRTSCSTSSPRVSRKSARSRERWRSASSRSEEHTSELQSPCNLVCRLLLEKKKTSSVPLTHQTCLQLAHHCA